MKEFHYSANEGRFELLITTIVYENATFEIVITEPLVCTLERAWRKREQKEWEQY